MGVELADTKWYKGIRKLKMLQTVMDFKIQWMWRKTITSQT